MQDQKSKQAAHCRAVLGQIKPGVTDPTEIVKALRQIKNEIIGNPTKKACYVSEGAYDILGDILRNTHSTDTIILRETAIVVGSFAHGEVEGDSPYPPLVRYLLDGLSSSDSYLQEAYARTLRIICEQQPGTVVSAEKEDFDHLCFLLESPNWIIVHSAAVTLSKVIDHSGHQRLVYKNEHFEKVIELTQSDKRKLVEAGLDIIAAVCINNAGNTLEFLTDHRSQMEHLLSLLRHPISSVRVRVCWVLTIFHCLDLVLDEPFCQKMELNVQQQVLPTLVRLLDDTDAYVRLKAPVVLGRLVHESENMQQIACEADAIMKLAKYFGAGEDGSGPKVQTRRLESGLVMGAAPASNNVLLDKSQGDAMSIDFTSTEITDQNDPALRRWTEREARLTATALNALADLCSKREESRKQIIESNVVSTIVQSLSHQHLGVRAAACNCLRMLSRSVHNLRTALVDAGCAIPIIELLDDDSLEVQIAATATLCNLVLDFSPMKKVVIAQGGVKKLVQLINCDQHELRLNSLWALKNLLYSADSETKDYVMSELPWTAMQTLLTDWSPEIKVQGLSLLRNMASGPDPDIEKIFDNMGQGFIDAIASALQYKNHPEVLLQALYIVCNVAVSKEHKAQLMPSSQILEAVIDALSHEGPELRVAALWCVINLTWKEDPGSAERIRVLRDMKVVEKIRGMKDDPDIDVRDRVLTALQQFDDDVQEMAVDE
eukprot:Clim_evm68s225 gene=Clim_evmTU68s225